VQFPEDKETVEKAMDAKGDLAFTVAVEVLPSFELADLSDVTVKKQVVTPSEAEVTSPSTGWRSKTGRSRRRTARWERPHANAACGMPR